MIFEQLRQFRQTIYEHLGKAKVAMFELMNADAQTFKFNDPMTYPQVRSHKPLLALLLRLAPLRLKNFIAEASKRFFCIADASECPIVAAS